MTRTFIILLLTLTSIGFSKPMESSRKTLFIYVHGINPSINGIGLVSDHDIKCLPDRGIGGNTFHKKGFTEWTREKLFNNYHHSFLQTFEDPGASPANLAEELGQRNRKNPEWTCSDQNPPLIFSYDEFEKEILLYSLDPINGPHTFQYSNWFEEATKEWFKHELIEFEIAKNISNPKQEITHFRNSDLFESRQFGNWETANNEDEDDEDNKYDNSVDFDERIFPAIGYNGDYELREWIKDYEGKNGVGNLPTLEQLRSKRPDLIPSRFVVFAHSMGGPTVREYIHSDYYVGDIDKVIT